MGRTKNIRGLRNLVGVMVLAQALTATIVFLWTLNVNDISMTDRALRTVNLSFVELTYSFETPPWYAIVAAIMVGSLVIGIFVGLEIRDANRSRRSHDGDRRPLAPAVLLQETRGQFNGPVSITVLIPAHNEEALIGATIESLRRQSRKPDRIIVVADNCIDNTVAIAESLGVEVIRSVNNTKKKAGALNQVLNQLLPSFGPNDTVMVMDADTTLRDGFLATANDHFTNDRGLSAIGGLFFGDGSKGLLAQLQRNEYTRYSREINRRGGRVFVLTGTASIFRSQSLKTVAEQRGAKLPGIKGEVYDTLALTEDNELTIALKSLGALMMSPRECMVETELMPDLKTLWRQRLRWQRGALENIGTYGITGTTMRYWSQQLGLAYSVFALWSFYLLITLQVVSSDVWVWYPFWLGTMFLFILEKVATLKGSDLKAKLLAMLLIPELLYDTYLDVIFVKGIIDMSRNKEAKWGHEIQDTKIQTKAVQN